ncbi:unnamed protein product [Rotaria sp. Silwood1]|nr:unnamed protein product [Rotaria sp. Silwood1]CAF1469937.1 unnamed protein product [Rotaria sp. Silwood1]CAF1521072.1 unnamed protein product [Rotaria sp. Silwood1]CAF3606951.1 unnamed protein product [Rotaria sp. Silwood1]CAF3610151.1 unnamed protein product [Rotaria sp. Silwood1]
MDDNYRIRIREILHRTSNHITEAEYVFDEIYANGKVRQYRISVKREEFERLAATIKKPTLSFDKFTKITRPLLMGHHAIEDIPEAFRLLDTDNSDTIDIGELAVFMPAIVPNSNSYMLLRYFQVADTNNDYRLNLDEFTEFIKKGIVRDLVLGRC